MKKPYQVTQEQFDILKERYVTMTGDGIDPRIRGLVDLIGSRDTITPVWSCSGHTQAEILEDLLDRSKRALSVDRLLPTAESTTEGYVIFVAAPGDEADLMSLMELVSQSDKGWLYKTYRPTLTLMTLVWMWDIDEEGKLTQTPISVDKVGNYPRYPLWKLQYRVPRNDDMQAHASGFVDICREYLNGSFKEQENV